MKFLLPGSIVVFCTAVFLPLALADPLLVAYGEDKSVEQAQATGIINKDEAPDQESKIKTDPGSEISSKDQERIENTEATEINETDESLPQAQRLLEFIDSLRGYGDQSFSFELNNVSYKENELKGRNKLAIKVLNESSLVEYLTPARQKGRKILKQGQNMWLHLPGTRNVLRITPAQRLLGEASNGDVTGTTFSQDYDAVLSGIEQLQEQKVYKLDLIARHPTAAYQKVVFYLKTDDYIPLRSDYYSRSGRLLKQAEYKEFKQFDGELKLHKMLLSDPIKKGSFTWMMFDNYRRENIDPAIFHKDSISR